MQIPDEVVNYRTTGGRCPVLRHGGPFSVRWARTGLLMESACYFGQGGRCQHLNGRRATNTRREHVELLFREGV